MKLRIALDIPSSLKVAAQNTENIIKSISKSEKKSESSVFDVSMELSYIENSNPLDSLVDNMTKRKEKNQEVK